MTHPSDDERQLRLGLIYGIAAYGSWGVIPLYFKLVGSIPAFEVLAHRIAWSFLFLTLIFACQQRWGELRQALGNWKVMRVLLASTLLIGANWFTFIYAVETNRVLEASIGYFITPLLSVLLGAVFLGERLSTTRKFAIGLALLGVLILTISKGHLPWTAVVLAASFSLYGLLRKTVAADGLLGLYVETAILFLPSLAYCLWTAGVGQSKFAEAIVWTQCLLALSGPITTIPLLLFAASTRRLPLSTVGMLQYLSPSLQFALAVAVFGEQFSTPQLASFICIWTAVAIFSLAPMRSWQATRTLPLPDGNPAKQGKTCPP